jgi:hypothetical protein
MQTIEQVIDSRINRRIKAGDRALTRLEKREARAEKLIGSIVREGEEVSYIFPQGGKYKEGRHFDLVAFLVRNNYV